MSIGSRRGSRMSRGSVTPADIYSEHGRHAVDVEADRDQLPGKRRVGIDACDSYDGRMNRGWSCCVGLNPDESLEPRMDHAIVGIISCDVKAEPVGLTPGEDSRVEAR